MEYAENQQTLNNKGKTPLWVLIVSESKLYRFLEDTYYDKALLKRQYMFADV